MKCLNVIRNIIVISIILAFKPCLALPTATQQLKDIKQSITAYKKKLVLIHKKLGESGN